MQIVDDTGICWTLGLCRGRTVQYVLGTQWQLDMSTRGLHLAADKLHATVVIQYDLLHQGVPARSAKRLLCFCVYQGQLRRLQGVGFVQWQPCDGLHAEQDLQGKSVYTPEQGRVRGLLGIAQDGHLVQLTGATRRLCFGRG